MKLSTAQQPKPKSETDSLRSGLKWVAMATGEVLVGLLVTTPENWLGRVSVISILLLGTFSLKLLLDYKSVQRDRDMLAAEVGALKVRDNDSSKVVLTESEFAILCIYANGGEHAPYDVERRLHLHRDDVADAIDKLKLLDLIKPEEDYHNMTFTGFYVVTRAGRQFVRKRREID